MDDLNRLERSFKARREDYAPLCDFVLTFVRKYTEDQRIQNDIRIALDEIFSNINYYSSADGQAPTDVTVTLGYENNTLDIRIADNGIPFDPLKQPDPSLRENRKNKIVGGFGIFMVRRLMDEVSYHYDRNNILTMKKKLVEASV